MIFCKYFCLQIAMHSVRVRCWFLCLHGSAIVAYLDFLCLLISVAT